MPFSKTNKTSPNSPNAFENFFFLFLFSICLGKAIKYRVEGCLGFKDFGLFTVKHFHLIRHFNPLKNYST